jgi:hypothetical protein
MAMEIGAVPSPIGWTSYDATKGKQVVTQAALERLVAR